MSRTVRRSSRSRTPKYYILTSPSSLPFLQIFFPCSPHLLSLAHLLYKLQATSCKHNPSQHHPLFLHRCRPNSTPRPRIRSPPLYSLPRMSRQRNDERGRKTRRLQSSGAIPSTNGSDPPARSQRPQNYCSWVRQTSSFNHSLRAHTHTHAHAHAHTHDLLNFALVAGQSESGTS